MPGSIQVSVLEFNGLLAPSTPSPIFIKVSIGKREYQTWDKGDFSFPLTTLRDDLIVKLLDAEGNVISHTGIKIMTIVQRGFWDDIFDLKGGGQVHMKLQLILSEEERHRVRNVRESALKKNHEEIIKRTSGYSDTARTAGGFVASSLSINHEVSASSQDSEKSVAGAGYVQASQRIADTSRKDSIPGNGDKEGNIQKEMFPNATDRKEGTSLVPKSQGSEVRLSGVDHTVSEEKIVIQLPLFDVPRGHEYGQEASPSLGGSKPVVATNNRLAPPELEYGSAASLHTFQGTEVCKPELEEKNDIHSRQADGSTGFTSAQEALFTPGRSELIVVTKNQLAPLKREDDMALIVPVSQGMEVHSPELHQAELVEKNDIQLPQADVSGRPISEQVASSKTGCTDSVVAKKKQLPALKLEDVSQGIEVQDMESVENKNIQLPNADVFTRHILGQEVSSMSGGSESVATAKNIFAPSEMEDDFASLVPLSPGVEGRLTERDHTALVQKSDIRLLVQEASSMSDSVESVIPGKKKLVSLELVGLTDKPEKQGPLEKTPSNVRKMISAFETSVTQDKRPTKLLGAKSQSKDQTAKDVAKPAVLSSGKLKSPFVTGDLPKAPTDITKVAELVGIEYGGFTPSQGPRELKEPTATKVEPEGTYTSLKNDSKLAQLQLNEGDLQPLEDVIERGKHIDVDINLGGEPSQAPKQLKELSATEGESAGTGKSVDNEVRSAQTEMYTKEQVESPEDLQRSFNSETMTVSGRTHEEQRHNIKAEQRSSIGTSIVEGKQMGIQPDNSSGFNTQWALNDHQVSVAYRGYENSSNLSSGAWIIPDDTRHLCITTGGENVMQLLEGCHAERETHTEIKSFSAAENVGMRMQCETVEKKPHQLRKTRLESSANDSSDAGPVRKVIKFAMIIGFGILVVLTRQREPRNEDRRPNDRSLATKDSVVL